MLLRQTCTVALEAQLVRPGIVSELIHRKLQKNLNLFRDNSDPVCWEIVATDRDRWKSMEARWIARWIQPIDATCSSTYLMHMQLLVIKQEALSFEAGPG